MRFLCVSYGAGRAHSFHSSSGMSVVREHSKGQLPLLLPSQGPRSKQNLSLSPRSLRSLSWRMRLLHQHLHLEDIRGRALLCKPVGPPSPLHLQAAHPPTETRLTISAWMAPTACFSLQDAFGSQKVAGTRAVLYSAHGTASPQSS